MIRSVLHFVRWHIKCFAAIAVVASAYWATRPVSLSSEEYASLVADFQFTASALPVPGRSGESAMRTIREVHPQLHHIRSWISSVGAAAALADLSGDGLPNDVAYVHVATDQVIIAPVPGTEQCREGYEPFALEPQDIEHDPRTMAPMGIIPADMTENGLMDVLVYYWGRPPIAFLRRGDTVGRPLSADLFVARPIAPVNERWFTNAATFADVDGDGRIDLIIGNYFADGSRILDAGSTERQQMHDSMSMAKNGGRNRVLLWAGADGGPEPDVRFIEADGALPDHVAHGWTLALAAADLDGDLLPELYVANDFGPSYLLHNRSEPGSVQFEVLRGRKRFTTPNSKVLGRDSFKGMGADFGDVNGDGLLDIFVSNIATDFALHESHFLWVSTGETELMREGIAPYEDRSEQLGVSRGGWGWCTKLADFNNDGHLEAVQATGFVKGRIDRWPELHELAMANDYMVHRPSSWFELGPGDDLSGHEPNLFYTRDENGVFRNIAASVGLADPVVTRGIAVADVTGNGKLDLVFANQWETSYFYRNESESAGAFLGLHLMHPLSPTGSAKVTAQPGHPVTVGQKQRRRPAIGAAASVTKPSGRMLVGQVDGGNGHSGVRSPALHFGLGEMRDDETVTVELRWRDPDGTTHRATIELPPGWHTITLGWPGSDVGASGDRHEGRKAGRHEEEPDASMPLSDAPRRGPMADDRLPIAGLIWSRP